jgi:hypothetical protein
MPVPNGQPPITPGVGVFSSDWLPGPEDGTGSSVLVSFTDFRATVTEDLAEIYRTGMDLGKNWPIMSGAVGLWLWGKPSELRGGSVSVWRTDDDLKRFVSWPVHLGIMENWRARIEVSTQRWSAPGFVAEQAWLRAERFMRLPPATLERNPRLMRQLG